MEKYTLFDDFRSYQPSFYPYKTDCLLSPKLPELDFLDAMLHESSFGMELVNDNHMESLTGNRPLRSTFEDEFANISDLNFTPTSCYENSYHVQYSGINYSVDISKERSNLLDEDIQRFKETNKEFNTNLFNLLSPVSLIQEQLQGKKIKLLLLASSLDKDKIVEKLKCGLEVEEDKMISFTNNTKCDNISFEGMYDLSESQCSLSGQVNTSVLEAECEKRQTVKRSCLKRVHEDDKDERYWKRRMKNNTAAKKSRTARKNRFALMEKRIKELEVENAEKREYLRTLKQKVLENSCRKINVSC